MEALVLRLGEITEKEESQAGRKAAHLSRLLSAGFPIPPGICLTTSAFTLALAPYQAEIKRLLAAPGLDQPGPAAQAADGIQALLTPLTFPAAISTHLANMLAQLAPAGTPLAVRSSAQVEDLPHASLAGQYESMLGPDRLDAVKEAILTVWRSFYHTQAIAARARAGEGQAGGMAVLIQTLAQADCAGVAFSIDPVNGRLDRVVINAAWGLGLGITSGTTPADLYVLDRSNLEVLTSQLAHQARQWQWDGQRVVKTGVPPARQEALCLPPSWSTRLAEFTLAAEQLSGCPQEVEWAIAAGQLWILQSRPITPLPAGWQKLLFPVTWDDPADARRLWRLNLPAAALPPLEIDRVTLAESIRLETCLYLGLERHQRLKVVNARLYFSPELTGLAPADRQVRQAAYTALKDRLHHEDRTSWDHWGPEIEGSALRLRKRLQDAQAATPTGPEIASILAEAMALFRWHMHLHPIQWFKPLPSYFSAYERARGGGSQDVETGAYALLSPAENSTSRMIDRLVEVAAKLKAAGLGKGRDLDLTHPVLAGELRRFLQEYGERTGEGYGSEYHLLRPTWAEDPAQVIDMLRRLLSGSIPNPIQARQAAYQQALSQVKRLCAACPDPQAGAAFRREWEYARRSLAVLEEHNHWIDQVANGQLRQAVMLAAQRLAQDGQTSQVDDIFWLQFREILDALQEGVLQQERVAQRQAEHSAFQELIPPPTLGLPPAGLPPWEPTPEINAGGSLPTDGRLWGQAASPGQVTGEAYVAVDDAHLLQLPPGRLILVARNLGPRWTPVLPALAGLVLDQGSLGQHAAAAAREYGVPAVVGTGDATRRITTGMRLRLDGSAGWIEILK